MLFDFIEKKDFKGLKKYIIENKTIDLDVMDIHSNYFIQYLVNYNMVKLIQYILTNYNILLDILDDDGRTLLYNPIKYNNILLLQLLLNFDKNSIGINILNIKDKMGYTALDYSIIFNNIKIFIILYQNNADIHTLDNNMNNIYNILLQYKRNDMMEFLLNNEIDKTMNKSLYLDNTGMSVLQNIIVYENMEMLDFIIEKTKFISNIVNNMEHEYGLTALHQCVIKSLNNISYKLIQCGADINISDYLGNTCIHYAMIEKNYSIIIEFIKNNINFINTLNISNMNGETPLHILLNNNIPTSINNNISTEYILILEKLLEFTNINTMNNNRDSILYLLVLKKLYKEENIIKILTNGTTVMNVFITNNDNMNILDIIDKDDKIEFIEIVVLSYYNLLQNSKNKDKLIIKWEKNCSMDISNNINKCKKMIRKTIIEKKRSFPEFIDIKIDLTKNISIMGCYYTGSTIDILFGLVYLYINHTNVNLVLEYPLTHNRELELYYKKIGLNYGFKLDFSNIELVWSYMKLISLTHFDYLVKEKIKNIDKQFIIIPLGIEVANGSHANIIIIDIINQTIERFEPNGKNCPLGFYYNPNLLDSILYNKFILLLPNFTYLKPSDFLPPIGFQIYEINKCKKLGDPNGFCAVWCVWWAEQRIKNPTIKPILLFSKLLETILLSTENFKNLIRNYSTHISSLRDLYLSKYKLTIDDIINNNYTNEDINMIEGDVMKIIQIN